jgi:hypothetical protein
VKSLHVRDRTLQRLALHVAQRVFGINEFLFADLQGLQHSAIESLRHLQYCCIAIGAYRGDDAAHLFRKFLGTFLCGSAQRITLLRERQ